jgi:hypothetical protein
LGIVPLPIGLKLKIAVALACLREDIGYLRHFRRSRLEPGAIGDIVGVVRSKGFCVLPGYFERSTCEVIAREIDAILRDSPGRAIVDAEQADHRIWGGERASARIKTFHDDPFLMSIGAAYLKTDIRNMTTLAAKIVARMGNKGSGGGWHRDSMYERQFKAIAYLSDVTSNDGPFRYLVGSNTLENIMQTIGLHQSSSLKDYQDFDFDAWCERTGRQIETVTGSAGDVILVDTRGIHRGMPVAAGCRYALTNYYSARHRYDALFREFERLIRF